ncbi:MAG: hypothetical protein LBH73_02380, partial [Spirochaetaceae bacterium]|nr:hypothetical protein [Spirochaetaceae bacterium]
MRQKRRQRSGLPPAWRGLCFCLVLALPAFHAAGETAAGTVSGGAANTATGGTAAVPAAGTAPLPEAPPPGELPNRPLRARTYLDSRRFVWHGQTESRLVIE